MPGQVQAYAYFGATLKNERWSWSAIAPDGQVVLTLWKDEFNYKTRPWSYSVFGSPKLTKWKSRPGNRDRIEHLKYARDHSNGMFRVVIATAKRTTADVRQIAEAFPQHRLVMRLTALDETTGEFRAEVVEEGSVSPLLTDNP